jgi:hypothetical protein
MHFQLMSTGEDVEQNSSNRPERVDGRCNCGRAYIAQQYIRGRFGQVEMERSEALKSAGDLPRRHVI